MLRRDQITDRVHAASMQDARHEIFDRSAQEIPAVDVWDSREIPSQWIADTPNNAMWRNRILRRFKAEKGAWLGEADRCWSATAVQNWVSICSLNPRGAMSLHFAVNTPEPASDSRKEASTL